MYREHKMTVIVAIAVALAFVMPVAAFANVGTIGVTSNSEITGDIENMVESTNSNNSDNIESTIDAEKPVIDTSVIDTEELSIVNDASSIIPSTGKTIYVDDDNTKGPWDGTREHPYQFIQVGVYNADAGDTVYVYNGTYCEHVVIRKQLDLVGESKENVIIDGSGSGNIVRVSANGVSIDTFAITNGGCGIYLDPSSNNNIIMNCTSYNNTHGIHLWEASNNNIMDCDSYNNSIGITFYRSPKNVLRNTNLYNNGQHLNIIGSALADFNQDVDPTNTINGKPICYIIEEHDKIYDGSVLDFGYIAMVSCTNITVKNSDVYGILLVDTSYSIVSNITSHGTASGIYLAFSYHNDIEGCTLYNNGWGINIDYSSYKTYVKECVAYNNSIHGFYNREYSDHNTFENCIAYNNKNTGIYVYDSENIGIINCTSYNNIKEGFRTYYNTIDLIFENCKAYDNKGDGFYIDGLGQGPSRELRFTNCDSYNNGEDGFYMRYFNNGNFTNCAFYDNGECNFVISGDRVSDFVHNIDPSNTIDGKPIYYLNGQSNIILDGETDNFGYIGLISCTNITVKNADVQGMVVVDTTYSTISNVISHESKVGIVMQDSSYNTLTDCYTYGCVYDLGGNPGIQASGSEYNTFERCNSNGNRGGMYFYESSNSNILNCTIYSCNSQGASEYGIYLLYSDNCNIEGCETYNNTYGINIYYGCNGGKIVNNSVHHNTISGIYIGRYSSNHLIHHNIFVGNGQNARDRSSNQWDNEYPSGGNYWDDYIGVDDYSGPDQNIPGSDGIGDMPYIIPNGLNQDNYPLMSPPDETPPIITDIVAIPNLQKYPTEPVNIACTVIDNVAIDTVKVHVDGPEGFTLEEEMNEGSYWYEDVYSILGEYDYFIWANDTIGNIAISDTYSFRVTDIVLPVSSVDPLPLWTNTVPFKVTATADAPIVDVTLYYRYSENGTDWTEWTSYGVDKEEPWNWEFTGSDGYYEFYSIARDETDVEDPPSTADASTGIDTVAPVTTIILDGTMGDNGWYTIIVTATLSATDDFSGVGATWYILDYGYWKIYSVPFTISSDGEHVVALYSFDRAGNKEDTNSINIKIDKISPITTHEFEGIPGADGWASNVTVTLSASDATSGVNYTKYKLDDGKWMIYADPFVVTDDGDHTLYYYSVDLAGNTETTKEVDFKIEHDIVPPVTTHNFSGVMGDNEWFTSNVAVTLTAVDDSSGVDYTMYKLDDGNWEPYINLFLVTEDGEHTLHYFSVDKVGNKEPVKKVTFKIDQTVPTIDLTWDKENSKLVANVSDETSGVAKVEFYVNDDLVGTVTTAPYEWEVTKPKKGDMGQAIVFDNASNEAISKEINAVSQGQSQSQSSSLISVQGSTLSNPEPELDVGRVWMRGLLFQCNCIGNVNHAFALRLHYIEFNGNERTDGVVNNNQVVFKDSAYMGRMYKIGTGLFTYVMGFFEGWLEIK